MSGLLCGIFPVEATGQCPLDPPYRPMGRPGNIHRGEEGELGSEP